MSHTYYRELWKQTLHTLVRDFKTWPSRTRLTDELEALISVILAIAAARLCKVEHVGWAAFSGYMVMRSHVKSSFDRGFHRVIGTVVGAATAWILITAFGHSTLVCSLALSVAGFVCSLLVFSHRRSYAWLFTGITFAMVLTSGSYDPSRVTWFAASRVIEVAIGTLSCVAVSAFSTYFIRRTPLPIAVRRAAQASMAGKANTSLNINYAAQSAVALALIPFCWRWIGSESAQQVTTTIFAVMAVPAASATMSLGPTSVKLALRLAGCFVGGILATGALLLGHKLPELMTLALCAGTICGRHLENGPHRFAYGGTQFVLAFLTVLVPDHYDTPDIDPGLSRVGGIVFGMILLEPIRVLFAFIYRISKGPSQE
jgi:uncharacterized membrane protein YccC